MICEPTTKCTSAVFANFERRLRARCGCFCLTDSGSAGLQSASHRPGASCNIGERAAAGVRPSPCRAPIAREPLKLTSMPWSRKSGMTCLSYASGGRRRPARLVGYACCGYLGGPIAGGRSNGCNLRAMRPDDAGALICTPTPKCTSTMLAKAASSDPGEIRGRSRALCGPLCLTDYA